jgi:cobalamin biosynthesis protein CobT
MGRRILNRKDLRADYEAAERRKGEDEETDEEEEEKDEDEDEGDAEEEGVEDQEGEEGEDEEEAPPKKKKPAKEPKAKAKAKPRSRAAKIVRMKVVWGVFNNSNQRVAVYEYPKRKDADEHAARLTADKKSTHFVQPVKEPIEEKKEA